MHPYWSRRGGHEESWVGLPGHVSSTTLHRTGWLSGRALDLGVQSRGFEPHRVYVLFFVFMHTS
jgi:hypothetical protein